MNIWILFHYAATPREQHTAHFDMAKRLVARGHQVTILASSFSHYQFSELRFLPGERGKWKLEELEGVRFVWIRTPPYQQNDWRRILNMLSYGWRSFSVGKSLAEQPDVIVGVTVHPVAALSAYFLSRLKRSRFVFEVRDLWPLTLVQFGRLSPRSPATWALRFLERFLCQRSERIITLLVNSEEHFAEYGVPQDKIIWLPQGVDLSRYDGVRPYAGIRSEPFIVMYLGGHVYNNALDVILRTAKLLQDEGCNNLRFVFVGGGQDKPILIKLSQDLDLKNVEFRSPVPRMEVPRIMGEADAFVFSMRNLPLYRYGVSLNKLGDYLGSGRPILFAGESGYNPVAAAKAGIVVPPEDPAALAYAIRELMGMTPEERAQMGQNGLRYLREYHDLDAATDRFESVLRQVAEGTTGHPPLQKDDASSQNALGG